MTGLRQIRVWALAGFLAIASLRCNGGGVPPTIPTDIEPVTGGGQSGVVGQVLANPLVVLVTDESGNAVPGVSVSWAAQGGGSVSATTVETGSNGRASVTRTLGPLVGEQTTTATVAGLQGSPVTFIATATEDVPPPPSLVITTNPPVTALTGEVFDPIAQPEVELKDGGGTPVAGAEVTASIASGGGALKGKTTATTDANGIAKFGDLGIEGTGEHTLEFTSGTERVTSSPVNLSPLPSEATTGKWGSLVEWDIVPLHMSLLPSGKIFAWGKTDVADTMGMPRVWDPSRGSPKGLAEIHVNDMLFCAGHTLMPDGQLLVSGGHHMDDRGIPTTYFFSAEGAFQRKGPDMAHGRWYPTVTVLADGRVLTMAGRNQANEVVTTPEIWEGDRWVELRGAGSLEIPYYPRNFVDPKNGLIFYASERVQSRWFNVDAGTGATRGAWTSGPTHIYGFNRDYGSAVMYESGKILVVGGGGHMSWPTPDPKSGQPTATAEVIDLNATSPSWQSTGSMAFRRRHMNATILPDGQVLATGGTTGGGFVDFSSGNAVRAAEVWNPTTGQWTTLASSSRVRVYHSVSLLLPNGTVLHGASGDAMAGSVPVPPERNHEIFEPPYMFRGARPTITAGPASVGYGETFSIATPNAAQITEVRWIRLGSVTHAFDASQRANRLSFRVSGGNVEVTAPAEAKQAPPGHYLLFILNRNGVPSPAKIVQIR